MVRKKRRRYKKQKQSENSSSSAITPHNLVNSIKEILRSLPKDERPKSALPTEIANFICTVFDTAALTQSRRRLRLNDTAEQLGYLEDEDLDKCYELIQQISKLVSEQDEQNDKTSEMNKNKWKLEREIRERNAKRQRNKNLFDRNQQRLQQEVNKVNAMIRSIKLNITTLEQQDQETLNDSSKKQTLKTKQAELRQKESEKQAKLNEIEDGKVEEEKRVNEENNAFGPLDEEDKKKITEIDDQLNELQKLTEERKKLISHLSNEYFLLMPREEFVNTYITAIDHRQMVNKYLRIMMSLCEHQVAISALMAAQFQYLRSKIHPIDYCYISLKCKILPIRSESYEFKLILSYINRTASPKILPKKLKIFEIWKENEEKLFEKYANYDNRMLLWHGSDTSNVAGILTKGLKIAPPEADATGYMFGKGVYFADAFQKSMGYASTGNQRNAANLRCLFLCRVALGKMFEAVIAEYMEDVKPGFHSTKGLGRKGPNPSNIKTTFDGAIIPDSETIDYPQRTMRDKENNIVPVPFMLNWNEYVVYNEEQAKLEYLIIIE